MLVLAYQLRAYILSEEGREVTLYRVQGGDTCVMSSSCLMDAIVFDVLIQAMEDTQVVTLPVTALSAPLPATPGGGALPLQDRQRALLRHHVDHAANPVHGDGPAGRHLPLGRVHPPGARPLHDP